jgi:tetratricopeptide (TPR) repeat protein
VEEVDLLERALEVLPDQAEVRQELAWAFLLGPAALRNPAQALPLARRAVALAPQEPLPLNTLGVAHYRLGQWDQAVESLQAAVRANRGEMTAYDAFFLAMSLHRLGRTEEAWANYHHALSGRAVPSDRDEAQAAELEAVRQEAERLLHGDAGGPPPITAEERAVAARTYAALGRWEQAVAQVENALAARPDDPALLAERGRALARLGRFEESAADLARVLELMPPDLSLWSERGRICHELAGEGEVFDRLHARRPGDPLLWFARGRAHARAGRWDRAVADFARGGEFGAATEYSFEHACLLLLQGNADGYRRLVTRMAEVDGRSTDPSRCFVLARTAALTPEGVVPSMDTVRWAEQAVAASPTPWSLHTLGLALARACRYDEAVRRLEESEAAGNWTGWVVNDLALALAYQGLGQDALARQRFNQAAGCLDVTPPAAFDEPGPLRMPDWLEAQALRREAESNFKKAQPRD